MDKTVESFRSEKSGFMGIGRRMYLTHCPALTPEIRYHTTYYLATLLIGHTHTWHFAPYYILLGFSYCHA